MSHRPSRSAAVGALLLLLQREGFVLDTVGCLPLGGTPRSRRQAAKKWLLDAGNYRKLKVTRDNQVFYLRINPSTSNPGDWIGNDFFSEELKFIVDQFKTEWENVVVK